MNSQKEYFFQSHKRVEVLLQHNLLSKWYQFWYIEAADRCEKRQTNWALPEEAVH